MHNAGVDKDDLYGFAKLKLEEVTFSNISVWNMTKVTTLSHKFSDIIRKLLSDQQPEFVHTHNRQVTAPAFTSNENPFGINSILCSIRVKVLQSGYTVLLLSSTFQLLFNRHCYTHILHPETLTAQRPSEHFFLALLELAKAFAAACCLAQAAERST